MKQEMKRMNILAIYGAIVIAATACGSTSNKSTQEEQVAVEAVPTMGYVNGVSDANAGMRTGEVELKGTIQARNFTKMYLYSTYGKNNSVVDSTAIVDGKWDFGKIKIEQGIYMLGIAENNLAPIILNPSEPVTEVGFRSGRMDGSLFAINSNENKAWTTYIPQEVQLQKAIKDAMIAMNKSSLKGEYQKQINDKQAELSALQAKMIAEYPNTHFAKIVTWKQEPSLTEIGKYWENIDFSDRSLIHGTILSDRIQNFMRSFSKGQESGCINCVSVVAEAAKADDVVLEFALNQMLIGFYESGMENISTFIIDNYVNGDSCGDADLSNIIKSTAESIQKLSIGNVPPNIQMTTSTGGSFDLFKTTAKNKYTLVLFWSSWCEHCQGEAPEVKQYYDLWHPKGFEIIGVSVDNNKNAWLSAIQDRGFTFPNVCGMKIWDSPVAKDYRVTKTPTFYLLDTNGKIVLKPKSIREVNNFLSQNLK
ncbi:MAG: TlpA disulfide reductase family protein [Flavobacteriales bacterium]